LKKPFTKDELIKALKDYPPTSKSEHAAKLAEISARDKTADFAKENPAMMKASAVASRDILPEKVAKEIATADPRLTADVLESKQAKVKKLIAGDPAATPPKAPMSPADARREVIMEQVEKMPASKIKDLSADVLDDSPDGKAVLAGLAKHRAGLQAIVREGGELHKKLEVGIVKELDNQIGKGYRDILDDDEKEIDKLEVEIQKAKDAGEGAQVKIFQAQRRVKIDARQTLLTGESDLAKDLVRARQNMKETVIKKSELDIV